MTKMMIYRRIKKGLEIAAGLSLMGMCSCAQPHQSQAAVNPTVAAYQAKTSQIIAHISSMMSQAVGVQSRGIVSYTGTGTATSTTTPTVTAAVAQTNSTQAAAQACIQGVASIQPSAANWSPMGTQLMGCLAQILQGQGAVMGTAYQNLSSTTQGQYVSVLNGGQTASGTTQTNLQNVANSGWDD